MLGGKTRTTGLKLQGSSFTEALSLYCLKRTWFIPPQEAIAGSHHTQKFSSNISLPFLREGGCTTASEGLGQSGLSRSFQSGFRPEYETKLHKAIIAIMTLFNILASPGQFVRQVYISGIYAWICIDLRSWKTKCHWFLQLQISTKEICWEIN